MVKKPPDEDSVYSITDSFSKLPAPRSIGAWTMMNLDVLTARQPLPNGIRSDDTVARVLNNVQARRIPIALPELAGP